jgi:deoxyribodipyrimidine photo-lyase
MEETHEMIQEERINHLNQNRVKKGEYVLYWMQSAVRTHYNHALEYSISKANHLNLPLIVYFGITDDFPEANQRHYYFLLEGLREVQSSLEERNINLACSIQSPELGVENLAQNSSLVVVDSGYMKIQRKWRELVANSIKCPLIQVATDVVVPINITSPKEEYAAYTIRNKIKKRLDDFMVPVEHQKPQVSSHKSDFDSTDLEDINQVIKSLKISEKVKNVDYFHGGTAEALKHLNNFLNNKLDKFPDLRNDPTQNYLSNMSPYLHFGHISPLYVALKVLKAGGPGKDAYLEELIIRRELSMNFIYYNPQYDSFEGLSEWSKRTLLEHQNDPREYVYSLKELEMAQTHDPYWNSAQKEMIITGKMHGYMRMYWGKKILEWLENPRNAFQIALYLNNKYELDGRDPNGFTGVAWCFGKHDRAWREREIFGKVRYMNANVLRRKFKIEEYVEKISEMEI